LRHKNSGAENDRQSRDREHGYCKKPADPHGVFPLPSVWLTYSKVAKAALTDG